MGLTRRGWIGAVSATLLCSAAPERLLAAPSPFPVYPPDILQSELKWLHDTLIDVGAKPFAYSDETLWRKNFSSTLRSLTSPMDAVSFWLVAGSLFADLNDAHVRLDANAIFRHQRDLGLRTFPLLLETRPSGSFVRIQTDDDFPAETRIDSIDAFSGLMLARSIAKLSGGQREIIRYLFGSSYIQPYLYAMRRNAVGFGVDGQRPDGSLVHKWLPARTGAEISASLKTPAQPKVINYTFSRLADGRIGYIDYRHCVDRQAFDVFLRETFASIKSQPITGLIIDIRDNSGGDSSLNNDLWTYVTDKPFAQSGGSYEKISDRLKREYGEQKYISIYGSSAWAAQDGSITGGPDVEFVHPGPNPLRYSGPVYLLIGSGTFSSALDCAVAARDYGLATIVGEETAQPVNSTGEVYSGQSPQIGMSFQFTTKYYVGPKPRPDGQGVLPDVRIVPTEDDMRHGRDPVLRYALGTLSR